MAATAEAQAEATREAQKAGIAHAKATEPHRYRGRKPTFDRAQLGIIRDLLAQDGSPTAIAGAARVSRQVVYRVQTDPAKADAMLAEWGMQSDTQPLARKTVRTKDMANANRSHEYELGHSDCELKSDWEPKPR